MICSTCGAEFSVDDLKITPCQKMVCPYCESEEPRPRFEWDKVNVKYREGNHD